jgi:transcriptional regulator with XRE-family HTH domain
MKRNPTPDGKWLASVRESMNLSQQELATLAGVSIPTIQRAESGDTPVRARSLQAIGRALGQPVRIKTSSGEVAVVPLSVNVPAPERITDEPPAWAREMLDELHALRSEVQDCHRRMEKDAS